MGDQRNDFPGQTDKPSLHAHVISRGASTMWALMEAVPGLEHMQAERTALDQALERGLFKPREEEVLFNWFARLLTIRAALLETIEELQDSLDGSPNHMCEPDEWRVFLLGYSAACLLLRIDRLLVEDVATHTLVQRKLNEGEPVRRIPRKQYTRVFKSLADTGNAWRLYQVMRFARKNEEKLDAMAADPNVGFLAEARVHLEIMLDPSKSNFLKRFLQYREHSLRRRGASALQQSSFALLEMGGRTVSEVRLNRTNKKVTPAIRAQLAHILEPGDVLVTRHEYAFTNLFLPGFWPHAALYIGSEQERHKLGITADPDLAARWGGPIRVLEALKDGVRFRPLEETLAVDVAAVIRPMLSREELAQALARVLVHEGKGYNFDFDFFRTDRLVCTEVVYQAYEGIGQMNIPLSKRGGRPTLAAQDLLDLALEGRMFRPVAVFGVPGAERLVTGEHAGELIRRSYRE